MSWFGRARDAERQLHALQAELIEVRSAVRDAEVKLGAQREQHAHELAECEDQLRHQAHLLATYEDEQADRRERLTQLARDLRVSQAAERAAVEREGALRDELATALRAVERAEAHADGCQRTLRVLLEPSLSNQCVKVRLRDRDEADRFGERLREDTGVETLSYACDFCPRQPVSGAKFWHITHADESRRGQHALGDRRRPNQLARRIPPEMVAAIRGKIKSPTEES